ncbi:RND transporter [Rickettsia felis]|nr:RND transporter [Rickettsia felis]
MRGSVLSSLREETASFDEAISGLWHEIATMLRSSQ